MPVQRTATYRTEDPFTRIPNAAVRDDALDLKALGLLVLMLSKPDGWRFNERNLAREAGVSRAQIRTAIGTLIDAGYVRRRHETENGTPIMVTEVYDRAQGRGGPEPVPAGGSGSASVSYPDGPVSGPCSNNGVLATKEDLPTTDEASDPDGSSSSPDVDEPVDEPTTSVAEEGWETARGLCEYLADVIVETGVSGTKRPNVTRAWVAEMERMIRLDGRDPDHVRRAIEWAHRGPGSHGNGNGWAGWGAVVRSPAKLRAKYDQMAQQAEARRRGSNGRANGNGYTGDDFRAAAAALREQGR